MPQIYFSKVIWSLFCSIVFRKFSGVWFWEKLFLFIDPKVWDVLNTIAQDILTLHGLSCLMKCFFALPVICSYWFQYQLYKIYLNEICLNEFLNMSCRTCSAKINICFLFLLLCILFIELGLYIYAFYLKIISIILNFIHLCISVKYSDQIVFI